MIKETTVERKGGLVPMVIGGLIAGGIGYGVATYMTPDTQAEIDAKLAAQAETIAGLTAQVEAAQTAASTAQETADAIDTAPLANALATLETQTDNADQGFTTQLTDVATTLDGLGTQLTGLEDRLTALEKKPIADNVSREAIAAYERELAALQKAMAGERAGIEELLDQQRAEVERIAAEASQMEENALAEAKRTAAREALARVQLALDSGEPYEGALADLAEASGATVPDGLQSSAADGVPTLAALQADFPGAARVALGAARDSGESGEDTGGVLGFLQAQVGARSVTPQEGNSADAILSRVEAAVKTNDLTTALSEIEGLPESSRSQLADWEAAARARLAAITDAATLAADLN